MKRYMVITILDGEQNAAFFDTFRQADDYRSIAEVSIGAYAEVYAYGKHDPDDQYEPESYICID